MTNTRVSLDPAAPVQAPIAQQYVTGEYRDEVHAEGDLAGIHTGEYGYKYRTIDSLVLPPYVTPKRLAAAQSVITRADDICYCSFPKSGSTWLANVLHLMLHDGVESDSDMPLRSNLHWMESSWTFPRTQAEVDAMPSPRIFKSHMPHGYALGGGPSKAPCRYIYIARNPKDVAVSYWHFESNQSWSGGYNGPWEHWLQLFLDGKVQRGSWFDHVLSWWHVKDAENMLFVKYEDLKRDFPSQLQRITNFTGHKLSGEAFEHVVNASSFKHMKQSRFANHQTMRGFENFFRKGETGSWKEQFTVAQSEAFDKLYKQRMAGSGLDFDFE
ncbi:hypothetical protein OEZ86_008300 [Tetradesmus obliquus]|nr:hypothetical protein OEZ86_008300 [Tetradesmus obliquus]